MLPPADENLKPFMSSLDFDWKARRKTVFNGPSAGSENVLRVCNFIPQITKTMLWTSHCALYFTFVGVVQHSGVPRVE